MSAALARRCATGFSGLVPGLGGAGRLGASRCVPRRCPRRPRRPRCRSPCLLTHSGAQQRRAPRRAGPAGVGPGTGARDVLHVRAGGDAGVCEPRGHRGGATARRGQSGRRRRRPQHRGPDYEARPRPDRRHAQPYGGAHAPAASRTPSRPSCLCAAAQPVLTRRPARFARSAPQERLGIDPNASVGVPMGAAPLRRLPCPTAPRCPHGRRSPRC